MEYKAAPFSPVWSDGIFNLPVKIADDYLKLASEYQIKALIYIMRRNGAAKTAEIAAAIGKSEAETDEILEFWTSEGVLSSEDGSGKMKVDENNFAPSSKQTPKRSAKETLSPPQLSPKDIVAALRENKNLEILVNEAQKAIGRTISTSEQSIIINMVNYYGLAPEVVLMILEYYRSEKQKGRQISFAYINTMAKNWSDEGIATVGAAEEKLRQVERSNRLWNEVVAITGIRHRRPNEKQAKTVREWFDDFDVAMITLAADIMKENIPEPKFSYMNSILKKWKKAGIKTPADVEKEHEEFEKKKVQKRSASNPGKLKSKPSYDLEKIKRDAMNNTDI